MKTTYTIKTKMPLPTVGAVPKRQSAWFLGDGGSADGTVRVVINTDKTMEWLSEVTKLIDHPSVLFGTLVDGTVVVSLTDEQVAKEFEAKWGGDA